MDELRPCPFCGGEGEIDSYYSSAYDRLMGLVRCKACGVKVFGEGISAYMVDTSASDFPDWKKKSYEEVERRAVEKWNGEIRE